MWLLVNLELERRSPDFYPRALLATLALVIICFYPYPNPKQRLQTRPRMPGALIVRTLSGHFPFQVSVPPIPTARRLVSHILWTKKEPSLVILEGGGSPPSYPRTFPELLTLGEGKAGAVGKVAAVWLLSL